MTRNIDIHKYWIDKANARVRMVWIVLLIITAVSTGTIAGLVMKIKYMEKKLEFYGQTNFKK